MESHSHACRIPEPGAGADAEWARLAFLARKVALVHGTHQPGMVPLSAAVGRLAAIPGQRLSSDDRTLLDHLTDGFRPWPGACGSVQALFAGLSAQVAAPHPGNS